MRFQLEHYIPFHWVDAAGIMFFGHASEIFHTAYERWLLESGQDWDYFFQNPDFAIPLKSFYTDYSSPIQAGKTYESELWVEKMGESSLTLRFRLAEMGRLSFESRSIHVFVDKKTFRSCPIPQNLQSFFAQYLQESLS